MKKLFLFLLLINAAAGAQQKIKWPHHKKAVIVLTYDDALRSQLDVAAPQLEAAHLTATFFLTGDIDAQSAPRWAALSKKGFELANHTVTHPCSVNEDTPVHSTNYSVKDIIAEIDSMNRILFSIDGKTKRTFAYPCAETTVGNGKDYVDSLKKSGLIKYARIGGDTDSAVITDFANLDPFRVPSYGLEANTPGDKLIAFVKLIESKGGMGVIMFHGIGGDYITTQAAAHQQLIDYLKSNKAIWVATFQQAMDYAMAHAR